MTSAHPGQTSGTCAQKVQAQAVQSAQINKALGAFLLFFGAVILFAIFFTDTGIGKLTNLGAGAVIGLIGGVMFLKGVQAGRRQT